MCGIFAYIGNDNNAAIKAIRGLKDLEYRGYDSWGIAVKTPQGIFYRKDAGKISDIAESDFGDISGVAALGHTRWATHGGVTPQNAHPHFNRDRNIAVIHNGIIENYETLKKELKESGVYFRSKTDTEVIPHLIDSFLEKGAEIEGAFVKTCRKLRGRFAFVMLHADSPHLYAARNGSPLVVGKNDTEYFLASDIPAFLDYTNIVNYVDNGEYLKTDGTAISFYNFADGKRVQKKDTKVSWTKQEATKDGYKHFMLKEILQQKETLPLALEQDEKTLAKAVKLLGNARNIVFTACGTAGHISMTAEYYFSLFAGRKAHFTPAGEFSKALPFIDKKTVVVAVTQSGETADLLEAIGLAKENGAKIISVLNVRGSSVERESDVFFPVNARPEIAVASTKAASSQLVVLVLLAYALAGNLKQGKKKLGNMIQSVNPWLSEGLQKNIEKIAGQISKNNHLYIIGKSSLAPMALEAALKIKEVSYIHAEGFAAGELKHGPIALIEEGTPCLALVQNDAFKEDVLGNSAELAARGADVVGIAPEKADVMSRHIGVPDLGELTPFAALIASQLLAYYLALARGIDPDKPRNLAKSVTVK